MVPAYCRTLVEDKYCPVITLVKRILLQEKQFVVLRLRQSIILVPDSVMMWPVRQQEKFLIPELVLLPNSVASLRLLPSVSHRGVPVKVPVQALLYQPQTAPVQIIYVVLRAILVFSKAEPDVQPRVLVKLYRPMIARVRRQNAVSVVVRRQEVLVPVRRQEVLVPVRRQHLKI